MGQVKNWVLTLDTFVAVITGYSIIDVLGIFIVFSLEELLDVRTICSLIVTVSASVYWIFRLTDWLANKPQRSERNKLEIENIELENAKKKVELKKAINENRLKEFQLRQYESSDSNRAS